MQLPLYVVLANVKVPPHPLFSLHMIEVAVKVATFFQYLSPLEFFLSKVDEARVLNERFHFFVEVLTELEATCGVQRGTEAPREGH